MPDTIWEMMDLLRKEPAMTDDDTSGGTDAFVLTDYSLEQMLNAIKNFKKAFGNGPESLKSDLYPDGEIAMYSDGTLVGYIFWDNDCSDYVIQPVAGSRRTTYFGNATLRVVEE